MSLAPATILLAIAALAGVLALILLAGRAARAGGFGQPRPGQRLVLQESLALDRARRLSLIRCDGRDLLVLTGGGSDTVVAWLPGTQP